MPPQPLPPVEKTLLGSAVESADSGGNANRYSCSKTTNVIPRPRISQFGIGSFRPARGKCNAALEGCRARLAASQLPAIFQRTTDLFDRYMDADCRQSWLVYKMTGSGLLLGSVGFASQIPVFLFAPLGGMTADRVNRQKIVIATQTASMILALILAALTLTHRVHVTHIFVLASLLGVVNAFDIPGRQSFIVDMVGKEDLMNAIALNSSMFNGARVIGPAIAGVLVARLGEGWCFFANGVSYIAVIAGLMLMRVHAPARASTGASPIAHMVEGFRFVERTAPIRALLLLLGLVSAVGMPYTVLMPIFADKILHRGGRSSHRSSAPTIWARFVSAS